MKAALDTVQVMHTYITQHILSSDSRASKRVERLSKRNRSQKEHESRHSGTLTHGAIRVLGQNTCPPFILSPPSLPLAMEALSQKILSIIS